MCILVNWALCLSCESDVNANIAAGNLALRDRFITELFKCLAEGEGAILSLWHKRNEYYPAFQFRPGGDGIHPTVKAALAALPDRMSSWQCAFWFVSANGWLDGPAPVDVLDDLDGVIAAAKHEGEEIIG